MDQESHTHLSAEEQKGAKKSARTIKLVCAGLVLLLVLISVFMLLYRKPPKTVEQPRDPEAEAREALTREIEYYRTHGPKNQTPARSF